MTTPQLLGCVFGVLFVVVPMIVGMGPLITEWLERLRNTSAKAA